MPMKTKVNKSYAILSFAIKVTIAILSVWFLYQQIFIKNDIASVKHAFTNIFNNSETIILLLSVIVLMFFNWGLEALQWKYLVKKMEHISLLKSLQAVFSGVTIGLFTPNRIGEYGGRVFYLEKNNRLKGVLITIVGNFSQLIITLVLGAISLHLFFFYYFHLQSYVDFYTLLSAEIVLIFLSLLLSGLFFNLSSLSSFSKKIISNKYAAVFSYYNRNELSKVFLLSFARYLVFSLQFFILLKAGGINLIWSDAVTLIPLIFLVISTIPSFALTEIGVRGSAALFFIGLVSDKQVEIITAAFLLWLINISLPALIGLAGIFKVRLFSA